MGSNFEDIKDKRILKRTRCTLPVEITGNQLPLKNIQAETLDLSLTGASVLLNQDIPFAKFEFKTTKHYVGNIVKKICLSAHVKWKKTLDNSDAKCYGIEFVEMTESQSKQLETLIDDIISEMHKNSTIKNSCESIHIKASNISGLNIGFINTVNEFCCFLAQVEKECKEFELNKKPVTLDKQINFINSHMHSYKKMDDYFLKLWIASKQFSRKEHTSHHKYFQKYLLSYFVRETTPLNKRIYDKPLGYGGDYVVMNYMYADGYSGDDTFSKFIDRYTLYLPEARAHLFRRPYFKSKIVEVINNNLNAAQTKIASYACGPAVEIIDVFREHKIPDSAHFFMIDGEPLALEQFTNEASKIEKANKKKLNTKIFQKNVVELIKNGTYLPGVDNLDLVYSAGFFDYLSDRTCARLVSYLYKQLKVGGVFIGVNIYEDHPCRLGMEMVGEWYLNHRDETKMLNLAKNLPGAEVKVDFDPTRTNIYLMVKKLQ